MALDFVLLYLTEILTMNLRQARCTTSIYVDMKANPTIIREEMSHHDCVH